MNSRRPSIVSGAIRAALLCGAVLALAPVGSAYAEDLRIGLAADVTSMDPHWNNAGPNNAIALHIFESLVFMDKNARYIPGLALSWKPVNPTTWEIKLRPDVKWHDARRSRAPTSRPRSNAPRS